MNSFVEGMGTNAAVFRAGQIAGPLSKRGSWNKHEWFASIIAGSKHLKALPKIIGTFESVDWVPVDLVSGIMAELVGKLVRKRYVDIEQTLVYNLPVVNSKGISWSDLLPAVQYLTGTPQTLPLLARSTSSRRVPTKTVGLFYKHSIERHGSTWKIDVLPA